MPTARGQREAALIGLQYLTDARDQTNALGRDISGDNRRYSEGVNYSGMELADNVLREARERFGRLRPEMEATYHDTYLTARDQLAGGYDTAISRLSPYSAAGVNALTTLQGSLGLGGEPARNLAVNAFQATPGYQYQVDQATDQTARSAAALGMAGSGNTMAAIADRTRQMANQEYGGWQDRLSGLATAGQSAANSQATLGAQRGQGLASLATGYGDRQNQLRSDFGRNMGQLDVQRGQNVMDAYSRIAQQGVATRLGELSASANANVSTANSIAQMIYGAGAARDAASNARDNLPFQILGSVFGAGRSLAGLLGG